MFGKKEKNKKEKNKKEKKSNKRVTREFGQARLKHSTMGKRSCRLAVLSLGLLLISVGIAFWMRGKTVELVGGMGILAIVLAAMGIRAAIKGFRERERNYITCRIGVIGNGLLLVGLLIIFFGGLF